MTNEFTRGLQAQLRRKLASARWFAGHLCNTILGLVLLSTISLEFLVSKSAAGTFLRDANGKLSETAELLVNVTAVVICIVTLYMLHELLRRLAVRPSGKYLVAGLVIVSFVILSQQFIVAITDLRVGNSLDASAGEQLSLLNWLLVVASTIRSVVILFAAVTATAGLMLIKLGVVGMWKALRDKRDAMIIAQAIDDIDAGYQRVIHLNETSQEFNATSARHFAHAMADGMMEMSQTVTRYLNGPPSPSINPEQWLSELTEQFKEPFRPSDPQVAELVNRRLKQHVIDLALLPARPETLSSAARSDLLGYAEWLREQADIEVIYNATIMKMEAANA